MPAGTREDAGLLKDVSGSLLRISHSGFPVGGARAGLSALAICRITLPILGRHSGRGDSVIFVVLFLDVVMGTGGRRAQIGLQD